jgi:hypothetical protein
MAAAASEPPIPLPVPDAVALTLVARIDFPPPAGGAWLAADAAWVARIGPALRHAGIDLDASPEVFVRVAAVRPAAAHAAAPATDYDPALIERIADAVAGLRPAGRPRPQVAVHEEWRETDEPRVEVAVYARPRSG